MIGGKIKEVITAEKVLEKVSEYDIYRFYAGDFKINKVLYSPMPWRKDSTPSFLIGNKYGFLYHIDFGDPLIRGNCFDLVKQKFMCDYITALKIIDKDMLLGITSGVKEGYKEIINKYEPLKLGKEKRETLIQVRVGKFNDDEIAYWKSFHLERKDLKGDNFEVYAVRKLLIDRVAVPVLPQDLVFGYLFDDKYWKIYRPLNKEYKWISNTPIDIMYGKENINIHDFAVITKSVKDMLVIKKVYSSVCGVQNESLIAFSPENVKWLKENSPLQYLSYDCDGPGKKASHLVTSTFGFKHINVPDIYLEEGIKDFADLGRVHGLKTIEKHFKSKGL